MSLQRTRGAAPDQPDRPRRASVRQPGAARSPVRTVPGAVFGTVSGAVRRSGRGFASVVVPGRVRDLLAGLLGDLVRDALTPRPLAPLARLPLPARARDALPPAVDRALRLVPHAAVPALILVLVALQYQSDVGDADKLAGGCFVAGSLLLAISWPVAAGWLLVGAVGLSVFRPGGMAGPFPFADVAEWPNLLFYDSQGRPWAMAGFAALTAVALIVAVRLRLRAAVCLWCCMGLLAAVGNGPLAVGTWAMALLTAPMPLTALVVTGLREARAEAAAHAAATEAERSRRMLLEERAVIARELHDVVAHHMSVVAIQAEAAPYRVESPPPELEKAFAAVRDNAVAALAELRRVLGVVRAEPPASAASFGAGTRSGLDAPRPPAGASDSAAEATDSPIGAVQPTLAPQPTLADLDALVTGVRAVGSPVRKTVTGEVRRLPLGVELSAYRIVQEALSNALRHAPRAAVRVELVYEQAGLGFRIVNGPPSRTAGTSPGAGHGLTGMRERAAMLGGQLHAGPTEEGGFEVTGFLPEESATGSAAEATTAVLGPRASSSEDRDG
ncbi:sensor histidine kinase [Streptomyces marispadix]|uniref:histidine kinase n=1 Tax=Streptomyces marispadix TaxID=2922868 RepID=A0ABS9SZ62_9ACTN|nr:histidine kinase [Streptomyces marispadix]MCH6161331.1 histidine kinase [Streptomyces marispadix]